MKKLHAYLFFIFCISTIHAQTWQWGKRGGSTDDIPIDSQIRQEEAYSIVTDSQKNIYMLSFVGGSDLNFDGVADTIYETNNPANVDIALVSFSCDGTFRWSKIIGGSGQEDFFNLQIDSQDNIYMAGSFGNTATINTGPLHIDDDVTIADNPSDYRRLVVMKYNSLGQLQWYQRPEPNIIQLSSLSKNFEIDAAGNIYWLVYLGRPGTYANGALIITDVTKPWHVLKYNSSGTFVSDTVLDLQTPTTFDTVQFYRNPNNQRFFVSARALNDDGSVWATVGTETVTHSMFLACFDPAGQALWKRENTSNTIGTIQLYNILFDTDNSVYLGGRFFGLSSDNFMGLTVPGVIIPAFIMKIDDMATSAIWSTYHNRGAYGKGALVMKNNEIAFTDYCNGTNFAWGSQTLNAPASNQGSDVLFARFDKNTGSCLSLHKIPGNVGYEDYGCALAVDASGDYILGGNFSGTLTFNGGAQITNIGGQSDFFVAKFATQVCSPLSTENPEFDNLTYFPNPTTGILKIETTNHLTYELYDLKGGLVGQGAIDALQPTIDLSGFAAGTYVLKLNDEQAVRKVKVMKR